MYEAANEVAEDAHLDQLFLTVNNEDLTVPTVGDITSVEPATFWESTDVGGMVVEVAFHDTRAAKPEFTRTERLLTVARDVDTVIVDKADLDAWSDAAD